MKLSNSLISILHRSTSSKNNEIFFKSIRSSNLGKSSLVMLNPKIFELLSAFNPIFIVFENKFNCFRLKNMMTLFLQIYF